MVFCLLCLESLSKNGKEHIEIYSEVGCRLEISKIIATHFWLQVEKTNNLDEVLCLPCWDAVQSFHTFYLRIAAAHNYLEGLEFLSKVHNIDACCSEGLKLEKEIKEDDIEITSSDFFVTEVKVEVQDLELLPATEVIEENTPVNERSLRSRRRNRIPNGIIEFQKGNPEELNDADIKYEAGAEMPPDCYLKASKTETDEELSIIGGNAISIVKSETQKKRRGRPRKVKDVKMEVTNPEIDLKDRSNTASENEQIQQLVLEIMPGNPLNIEIPQFDMQAGPSTLDKKKLCRLCSRIDKAKRKTRFFCVKCSAPVCQQHSKVDYTCFSCKNEEETEE